MPSTPEPFDSCPVPQRKGANNVLGVIQLFEFLFFGVIAVCIFIFVPLKMPLKLLFILPPLTLAMVGLFGFYEGRVELIRISKITRTIDGKRRDKKQHIEGIFGDEQVWFSVSSKSLSINYAVRLDGQKALSCAANPREYLKRRLSDSGINGYRGLITEDALILSRFFMIAFQIRPKKAMDIYDALVRVKHEIIDQSRTNQELFPIFEE